MRYTLLELTQNILSSMDSEEINSISDTVESQQVVAIIKTVYNDIITRAGVLANKGLFTLIASTDDTKPVLMYLPDNIIDMEWLKYNKMSSTDTDPNWSIVHYVPIENFVEMTQSLSPSDSDVGSFTLVVDGHTFVFNYKNDTAPSYYTTFDDKTIVFDSYDIGVDDTLQTSKTLAFGSKDQVFTEADNFVPNLKPDQFALLLSEAKSLAWAELKQAPHLKAEQSARRNWSHVSKTRQHIPSGNFYSGNHAKDARPNFGRK